MNQRRSFCLISVVVIVCLNVISFKSGFASEVQATEYNGYYIYVVPYGGKVNTLNAELFPHYMPLRKKAGWKYALIDLGYQLTNPIMVEEIPAGTKEIMGRYSISETLIIVLNGRGYSEIRDETEAVIKKIPWNKGDMFVAPQGLWVGYANPDEQTARLLSISVTLDNELLDQNIMFKDGRTKDPFVLRILPDEKSDTLVSGTFSLANQDPHLLPESAKEKYLFNRYSIYETSWGNPINLDSVELSVHGYPLRSKEEWKSVWLHMGGKIINHLIIQEVPARAEAIGHKHSYDVVFFAIDGKGNFLIKDELESPQRKIEWVPGDLFCLPWTKDGTWHAHENPYDKPAKLLATVHNLNGLQLLDPFVGRVEKRYRKKGESHKDIFFEE